MWATPLHAPVTTFVPGSSVPARPDRPAFLRAVRFPEPEAGEVVLVAMSLILGRYCAPAQQIRRIRRATAGLRRRDFPRQVRCGTKTGSSAVSSASWGDRTGPAGKNRRNTDGVPRPLRVRRCLDAPPEFRSSEKPPAPVRPSLAGAQQFPAGAQRVARSEEHTSELQSRGHLVCRLLLEK